MTAASPTYGYPPGPPPPYSQPPPATTHHATAWAHTNAPRVHTPPESRRTSGDEDAKQRQSLPSISEALGVDSQTSFHSSTLHQSHAQTAPASPPSVKRYRMEPPSAIQHSTPTSTYPSYSQHVCLTESGSACRGVSLISLPQQRAEPPQLHVHTTQPLPQPQQPSYAYPASTSPNVSAAPTSFPYGYAPYPPRYAQPTPPASTTSGPIYQPSATYSAPSAAASSWRSETGSRASATDPVSGAGDYSASVKRHLDLYDLEGALNDISSSAGILADFSRRYGDRLHQTARSGTTGSRGSKTNSGWKTLPTPRWTSMS